MTAIKDDLVGRSFRTFDDEGDHKYQGQILSRLEGGFYTFQLFEWILGEPSCVKIAHISDMPNWAFYLDAEDWREAGDNNKYHGGALNGVGKSKPINDVFSR